MQNDNQSEQKIKDIVKKINKFNNNYNQFKSLNEKNNEYENLKCIESVNKNNLLVKLLIYGQLGSLVVIIIFIFLIFFLD